MSKIVEINYCNKEVGLNKKCKLMSK